MLDGGVIVYGNYVQSSWTSLAGYIFSNLLFKMLHKHLANIVLYICQNFMSSWSKFLGKMFIKYLTNILLMFGKHLKSFQLI